MAKIQSSFQFSATPYVSTVNLNQGADFLQKLILQTLYKIKPETSNVENSETHRYGAFEYFAEGKLFRQFLLVPGVSTVRENCNMNEMEFKILLINFLQENHLMHLHRNDFTKK
jgi:hypothetical protein